MSNIRPEDRPFAGTEVGRLIGLLRYEISNLDKGLQALHEDVKIIQKDVKDIKGSLTAIIDTFRDASLRSA